MTSYARAGRKLGGPGRLAAPKGPGATPQDRRRRAALRSDSNRFEWDWSRIGGRSLPPNSENERSSGLENEAERVAEKAMAQTPMLPGPGLEQAGETPEEGVPLPSQLRNSFEQTLETDLGSVRLHMGQKAENTADALNAKAFTVGSDIAFGSGQFRPNSREGMRLIAHEVGHVIQQRHNPGKSAPQCKPKDQSQTPDVHRLARRIHEAFEETGFLGFGATNEAVVFEVLRTAREYGLTSELKAVYGAEYPNEFGLEARLADELSGDELDTALELLRAGLAASEHRTRSRVSVVGHGASESAVRAAQDSQVFDQLAERNEVQIQNDTIEIHVIPHNKKLTDLPEFAHLKGVKTFDGRKYDDLRGVGGMRVGKVIRFAVAEEQLVSVAGAPPGYGPGFVTAHESGHVVMDFALTSSQQTRLKAAYDARKKANGPWLPPPAYTSSSSSEYWAQVSAAYFGKPYSDTEEHRKVFNRDWLKQNDPAIFKLLQEVYR